MRARGVPAAACRREISEELGLDRTPHRLISVDWAPHEREGDKMLFLFDCGDLGADEDRRSGTREIHCTATVCRA